jgi:uncharacterized delta-60 repeat protein
MCENIRAGYNVSRLGVTLGLWASIMLLALLTTSAAVAAPGDLDSSFGQGGEVVLETNPGCLDGCAEFFGSYATALALQPGGGVVLAGNGSSAGPDAQDAWLVRLSADGALDPAFGAGAPVESAPRLRISHIYGTAGRGLFVLGATVQGQVGVEHYTASGVLDSSFGSRGVRWLSTPGRSVEETMDAAGRIVVLSRVSKRRIEVKRFLPSGAPDARFGSHGVAGLRALPTAEDENVALVTQRDSSVVVTGTTSLHGRLALFLARLTLAGKLDPSFGKGGISYLPIAVLERSRHPVSMKLVLAVAPDRHIMVATDQASLILLNYTSSGRLDRSFGKDGIARTAPPVQGWLAVGYPTAIGFGASGDAIVVGEHALPMVDEAKGLWFLARYTPNGRDCSFGVGGIVLSGAQGGANAIAVQPDGRIVIGGWSPSVRGGRPSGAGEAFMVARYVGGGAPRTCPGEPSNPKSHHRGLALIAQSTASDDTLDDGETVGVMLAFGCLVLSLLLAVACKRHAADQHQPSG